MVKLMDKIKEIIGMLPISDISLSLPCLDSPICSIFERSLPVQVNGGAKPIVKV